MSSRMKFWLVVLFGWLIACGSLSAQPAPDSAKQSPGAVSIKVDSAGMQFPSSYDPKVLQEIRALSPEEFACPVVTVSHFDSAASTTGSKKAAFVWMKVRVDRDHRVSDARVVYCSAPGEGLEKTALEVTTGAPIVSFDDSRKVEWLWHQVLFIGSCGTNGGDTLGIPQPDEFIAAEVLPEMISQVKPLYPESCKKKGQSGKVFVKVLVGRDGLVQCALTGKSSGVSALDEAAAASAYGNIFKPGMQDGHPVALWVTYKIEYALGQFKLNGL